MLIVIPGLGNEAEKFASQQRIKVIEVRDLEAVPTSTTSQPRLEVKREPFKFQSESQLIQHLRRHGYQV